MLHVADKWLPALEYSACLARLQRQSMDTAVRQKWWPASVQKAHMTVTDGHQFEHVLMVQ